MRSKVSQMRLGRVTGSGRRQSCQCRESCAESKPRAIFMLLVLRGSRGRKLRLLRPCHWASQKRSRAARARCRRGSSVQTEKGTFAHDALRQAATHAVAMLRVSVSPPFQSAHTQNAAAPL